MVVQCARDARCALCDAWSGMRVTWRARGVHVVSRMRCMARRLQRRAPCAARGVRRAALQLHVEVAARRQGHMSGWVVLLVEALLRLGARGVGDGKWHIIFWDFFWLFLFKTMNP